MLKKVLILFAFLPLITYAQNSKKTKTEQKSSPIQQAVSGLKFRAIGPAWTSGRVSDIAVDPADKSVIYIAAASGGVWKSTNSGLSFKPIFDKYGSYSIGCVTIDPDNHNIIWVGTGENNFQRSVGYGDGVYKSLDGGKTFKNMGLKNSQNIGEIAVDPTNSNIVYVAAEGPIWASGGDRGLYKTTDGGKTWKRILYVDQYTGVNNIIIDPRNPQVLYATTEQRCRRVWTKIGVGPNVAIYKSEDGGQTWRKLQNGLPDGWKGKISIAMSPVNPDVLYAMIYGGKKTGGFFRSTDRGESWQKMSDFNTSGQYFDRIFCDPKDVDKVYAIDVVSKFTEDGGKTWKKLGITGKHVDDHVFWIDPDNTSHILAGCDGGLYETFDGGKNWRHFDNLPIVQFYRVYVDNQEPFYYVYGGTQDNSSIGGPSRNLSSQGVTSCDWYTTVGGDGFWGMVDPQNPDIVYSEYQYGNLYRYDRKSGERLYIRPQPGENELTYRWNWNAPFLISPHNHKRLYIAANYVFRSDDMGQSWEKISPDLTRNMDRNFKPCMGKYWPFDTPGKDVSTSLWGTIVAMDESPLVEGLIYVGTDDGLVQITEDGGKHWRKIEKIGDVPEYSYVSDILADRFDPNTVYVTFDNHKQNDFKPYVFVSHDRGKTWKSISNDLPEKGTVYTIAQDFKDKNLLFVGTEFGVFFSYNGGKNWVQLKSGLPTIAVYDMAIQQQKSDLVLATFGRGFYILDDYSPLRFLNKKFLDSTAYIFPVRPGYIYIQKNGKYAQGTNHFIAKNPKFGVTFYYYLKQAPKSSRELRHEREKELWKQGKPIPQISWKQYEDEDKEEPSYLLFTIYDSDGNIVRKITAKPQKGIHRVTWNLRYPGPRPVEQEKFDPFKKDNGGIFVMPGKYYVSMALYDKGQYKPLFKKVPFEVKPLHNRTISSYMEQIVAFERQVTEMSRVVLGAMKYSDELMKRVQSIKQAILATPEASPQLMSQVQSIERQLDSVIFVFKGVKPKASYEEIPPHKWPIYERLQYLIYAHYESLGPITTTERQQLDILQKQVPGQIEALKNLTQQIQNIEKQLDNLKSPWTPGRLLELKE